MVERVSKLVTVGVKKIHRTLKSLGLNIQYSRRFLRVSKLILRVQNYSNFHENIF